MSRVGADVSDQRWNLDAEIGWEVEFTITGIEPGRYLDLLYGPAAIPPLPPEIATWQDDGGAILPDEDGYTHLLGPT